MSTAATEKKPKKAKRPKQSCQQQRDAKHQLEHEERDLKLEQKTVVQIACRVEPALLAEAESRRVRLRRYAWDAEPPGENPFEAQRRAFERSHSRNANGVGMRRQRKLHAGRLRRKRRRRPPRKPRHNAGRS